MKKNIFIINNFCLLVFVFFIFVNIVNSVEEDDEEDPTYYIYFDFNRSDPNIKYIVKGDNNPEVKDIVSKSRSIKIPEVELDTDDTFFSGWTEDGIYGYESGDTFICRSKNCTLKPVFGVLADKRTFTLDYIVEFEGVINNETHISRQYYCKNRIVTTNMLSFNQKTAAHRGWTDGEHEFAQEQRFVMPEHNVTLRAIYLYYRNLTYLPGNVDGLSGTTSNTQIIRARGDIDLAESTRLTRLGYTIKAWHCENDGIDYPLFYQYIMPDEDVIMTAVWEPIFYIVSFRSGVKSIPDIKIREQTNNIIIAPDLDDREGYTFRGWVMYKTDVYIPGDEIVVKGQLPGTGIGGQAIWTEN